MKSNHGTMGASIQPSGKPVDDSTGMALGTSRQRLLTRVAIGGAILLAAVTVSVMLSNCGGHSTETSGASSNSGDASQAVPAVSTGSAPVASPAIQGRQSGTVGLADTSSQSRSPDLAASVSDTVVVPGAIVEIAAEATADVTEILLWDGIHDKQPMVYDMDGKVWTTRYRVPLRTSSDRVALSVTATNDLKRWRRVWVFVRVQQSGEASDTVRSSNEEFQESDCDEVDE